MSVPQPAQRRRLGYAMVAMAALFWGANGPASTLALRAGASPETIATLRVTGTAALLLVLSIPILKSLRATLDRRDVREIVLFGLFGISLAQWIFLQAITRFPVGLALVIIYTAPFWVAAFERAVHGVTPPPLVWLAMSVALVGIAIAVLGVDGGAGTLSLAGFVLSVLGAFASAAQLLLARRLPPIAAHARLGLAMLAGAAFWAVVSPWWTFPTGLLDDTVAIGRHLDTSVGLLLVAMVVFGCAVPYYGLVRGVELIGPASAGVTGMLEPIVAFTLGWIVLDQTLTPTQIAGAATALVAITTAETVRSSAPAGGP